MLYEVITVPRWCVDLFPERDKLKVINTNDAREPIYLVQKINKNLARRYDYIVADVITSYSIHYTKLYDNTKSAIFT